MRHVLTGHDSVVGPWVASRVQTVWAPQRSACVGLFSVQEGLQAGVIFEGYNGANIGAHIAVADGRSLTREFLWFCFYYAFQQLQCKRMTGSVASSNARARKLNERLGFQLEATLADAHPEGDLLIYVMRKENCKWLRTEKV